MAIVIVPLVVPWAFAFAQLPVVGFSGGGGGTRAGGFQGHATFTLPMPSLTVLAGAPYSGQQTDTVVQTLPDGTHITRSTGFHQKAWRDSQGRVRTERPVLAGPNTLKGVPTVVEIQDPVAGYTYIMDDVSRVVHRIKLSIAPQPTTTAHSQTAQRAVPNPNSAAFLSQPGGPQPRSSAAQTAGSNNPQPPQNSVESLGTQVIEGVECIGTRFTYVTPPSPRGADVPITTIRDQWVSPDLHLTVLTVTTNPSSVTTSQIANLSRIEPDPALFQVPLDYTMADETQTFTMKWGAD